MYGLFAFALREENCDKLQFARGKATPYQQAGVLELCNV